MKKVLYHINDEWNDKILHSNHNTPDFSLDNLKYENKEQLRIVLYHTICDLLFYGC